jgi:7,8-dihydro-6-hydroxymethylpterin-pyrophosphokinase
MLVKDGNSTETIGIADKTDEGKVYFTFTLQAREGSRTSDIQCACETNVEREKLIATIQNIEQVARSRKQSPAPKSRGSSPTALARPLKGREELKSRVLYECWAIKRGEGGLLHSSAYRKRYFIITDQQRLNYYESPEDYYLSREPKGTLSCVGMLVKDGNSTETIGIADKTDEGKVYFTFTLQAREGSRTSDIQCACETNVEREKLIATIQNIEQVARSRKESPAPKSRGSSPTALARPLNGSLPTSPTTPSLKESPTPNGRITSPTAFKKMQMPEGDTGPSPLERPKSERPKSLFEVVEAQWGEMLDVFVCCEPVAQVQARPLISKEAAAPPRPIGTLTGCVKQSPVPIQIGS